MATWPPKWTPSPLHLCLLACHVYSVCSLSIAEQATPTPSTVRLNSTLTFTSRNLEEAIQSLCNRCLHFFRDRYEPATYGGLGVWKLVQLVGACSLFQALWIWRKRQAIGSTIPVDREKASWRSFEDPVRSSVLPSTSGRIGEPIPIKDSYYRNVHQLMII